MLISTLKIKTKNLNSTDKKADILNTSSSTISWAGSNYNMQQPNNEQNNFLLDENKFDYTEYFGVDDFIFENSEFNDIILEAKCKSASYAFKIFSIEYFQLLVEKIMCVDTPTVASSGVSTAPSERALSEKFFKFLSENVLDHNLIEKWLNFYAFQLKKDLNDEAKINLTKIEVFFQMNIENNFNSKAVYQQNQNELNKSDKSCNLKSKLLFDSIKTFLLLVNKISRHGTSKISAITNLVSVKRIKLNDVFCCLIESLDHIIDYFLYTIA